MEIEWKGRGKMKWKHGLCSGWLCQAEGLTQISGECIKGSVGILVCVRTFSVQLFWGTQTSDPSTNK